jgi:DNA-binding NtrC family response regulator
VTAPRKVLIIEDNAVDSSLLATMLRHGRIKDFSVSTAASLEDALGQLAREKFHAVISDLTLPDSSGIETFVKLHAAAGQAPILVISGTDDETVAVNAVRKARRIIW